MNSFVSTSSISVRHEYRIGSLLAEELPSARCFSRSASSSALSMEKVRLLPLDHESFTHQPGKERQTDPLRGSDPYETQSPEVRELVLPSSNEEELHTSFEHALHKRLVGLRVRLMRLNPSQLRTGCIEAPDTAIHKQSTSSSKDVSFLSQTPGQAFPALFEQRWVSWLLFW